MYTAVLATSEYGTVDLVTSTASLLTPILMLSIFDATLRFGMDPEYKQEDVLSTTLNIALKGTIVLIIGVIVSSILHIVTCSWKYLIFLCAYFVLGALNQIFNLYLKAKNQAAVIVVSGIICTLVTCLSNIVLLLVLKWGIVGYMVSNTIGVLIQNIYQLFVGKVYKDIRVRNYNNLSLPMLKYSSPLIANSISWWINSASDRYILSFIRGVAENGIYAVSYKIPTILSMFQGIFYNAWSISAIAEFDEHDEDGFIGLNYTMYSFISLLVCSSLLVINIPLAQFLYKGDYFEAWKCVPFLLMGTVFSGISQFEGSLFAATKKTKMVAKTTVIGALVNTLGNVVLIYFLGAIGAALSTLLGYFTTWCLRTKNLESFVKLKVNWRLHFLSIMVVAIQASIATLGISSFIQIVFLLLLVLLNKKYIVPVLKTIARNK